MTKTGDETGEPRWNRYVDKRERAHEYRAWWGAVTVMMITAVLVILDLGVGSVHRYWSRHSFTSSVLAGLLVLLLTVLIVDRVTRMRQLRNQSRAIAVQAAIIVAQARWAADAISRASPSLEDQEAAFNELRAYTQMLFTSAPVLIDATATRAFLETAQRVAGQLLRALRETRDENLEHTKAQLDAAVEQVRRAAAPLMASLNREQLAAAFGSDHVESLEG
jgi:hypothetical protein